jgi:hypothetical protein
VDTWRHAKPSDHHVFKVVALIFHNHPELLEFFFEKERPRIRFQAIEMRRHAAGMSSGEQLLLRVALDVWGGSGNAKIWQLIETLDSGNLANVLKALALLRGLPPAN